MLNPAMTSRLSFLLCPLVLFLPVFFHHDAAGQAKKPAAKSTSSQNRTPIRIAVLPFRNSLPQQRLGNEDIAVLGDGISDSLTNAMKSVAKVIVIDTELVLKAAEQFPNAQITAKDEDAIQVANSLSAQIVVAGSFQLLGNRLHVDARILTIDAAQPIPAQIITVDATYPDGYSTLLTQLAQSVITKLKLPLTKLEAEAMQTTLAGTRSPQAYQSYMRGIQQMRSGTPEALSQAIEFFQQAIEADPNYALAHAAKSEAETQLFGRKKASGEPSDALGQAALNDARNAVKSAPGLGRGHRALARAQSSLGDYAAATQAAQQAAKVWPGDVAAIVDIVRALEGGEFKRTKETDRAFNLLPGLALLIPELPKVRVHNESEFPLTLRFTPTQGAAYPAVQIKPNSARMVPLFPGQYQVLAESAAGTLTQQHSFEAGQDYQLTFSATSFPAATLTFVNSGGYPLQVQVAGPTKKSLTVRPKATDSIKVSPGTYSITARVMSATKSDRIELSEGHEETLTYEYRISGGAVFNPAQLTIENDGNSLLLADIKGPKRLRVSIPPGGKTFTLPAGTYTIRVSCGSQVSDDGEHELEPNTETTVTGYSCIIRQVRYVYR